MKKYVSTIYFKVDESTDAIHANSVAIKALEQFSPNVKVTEGYLQTEVEYISPFSSQTEQTNMKAKKVRGRPKLSLTKVRKIHIMFRINKSEQIAIRKAAKRAQLKRSIWMRQTILKAAQAWNCRSQ